MPSDMLSVTTEVKERSIEPKNLELLQMSQAVNLIGSWEWDLATNKIFWTDEMFQLRAAPIASDHIITFEDTLHFIHEDDRKKVMENLNSLKNKEDISFEYRIISNEGDVKIVQSWAAMFRDEKGNPLLIRGTSQDVTKLRLSEKKLSEANDVLRHAEEIAGMGSWQLNLHSGKYTYSENMFRLLGCQLQEVDPSFENLIDLVHPEDREMVKHSRKDSLEETNSSELEYRLIRKDGVIRQFKESQKISTNDQNQRVKFGTTRDITEENIVIRELEERTAFSEMLFDNTVDVIAAFDTNLNVIAWNRQCEEKYGLKREHVIGKNVLDIYPNIGNDNKLQDLQQAAKGQYINRKGQVSSVIPGYFDSYIIPLKKSTGEIFGVLSVAHDVSELKNVNEQLTFLNRSLVQKNRELEISNNELASFSYIASHDLQEPLRKIQTFSKRIVDKEAEFLSPQGKDYLKRMENASQRMQNLIDDLLTFSRTSTMPKEFQKISLNNILEEVKREMKDVLEEKQAVINSKQLPEISVIAFQFRQLLVNMISNSLKYCKPGIPPIINIHSEEVDHNELPELATDTRYYKIIVKDNGIGFEQQYSERIFGLFQRLHGKYEYPGTGLGLAICRKIVQNHSGIIKAKGEPGRGAEFSVYLPQEE